MGNKNKWLETTVCNPLKINMKNSSCYKSKKIDVVMLLYFTVPKRVGS